MTTTIPNLKHQFLVGQVRILNAPLDPPEEWRDAAPKVKTGNLSDRAVDDVLLKANRLLRAHNANCFPPMVLTHVAAQIDSLYWTRTTTASLLSGAVDDPDAIPLDADLRDDTIIASLPDSIPASGGDSQNQSSPSRSHSRKSVLESDDLSTRYGRLVAELRDCAERRRAALEKIEQARLLLDLLSPLENPEENVQGNLLVGGGELERELMKMKKLLGKINGSSS